MLLLLLSRGEARLEIVHVILTATPVTVVLTKALLFTPQIITIRHVVTHSQLHILDPDALSSRTSLSPFHDTWLSQPACVSSHTYFSLCVSLKLLMILFRPHLKRKVLRLTAQWSFWRRHRTGVAAPSTHPLPDDGRLHSTPLHQSDE